MNYLITAAGYGSRFIQQGIKPPKPLIKALGRELLLWSLSSFPIGLSDKLFIVTLRSHSVKKRLEKIIKFLYPCTELQWLEIDNVLPGQLITAVTAIHHFNISGAVVIHNCDTYYDASRLDFISLLENGDCFGIIPCFHGDGEHWSFVRTEQSCFELAIEVAEKRKISDLCSVGTYIFSDAIQASSLTEEYIKSMVNINEYYIAPLYQFAIEQGKTVRVCSAETTRLFGTPEELLATFNLNRFELLAENAWNAHQRGTLVVDIDGTLCGGNNNGDYGKVKPIHAVCEALKNAHANGIYIILFTARNMRTFKGSLGLINKYTAPILLDWLSANHIPYDEIYYGKPWGTDVSYIDDKSISINDFILMHNQHLIK